MLRLSGAVKLLVLRLCGTDVSFLKRSLNNYQRGKDMKIIWSYWCGE